jgi:hypothetical protein
MHVLQMVLAVGAVVLALGVDLRDLDDPEGPR